MSITIKDIENLANLSRIGLTEEEKEKMTSEIEAILGYVSKVKDIKITNTADNHTLINVMRDDVVTNKTGEFTEKLLSLAPQRQGNYLKVKKIL